MGSREFCSTLCCWSMRQEADSGLSQKNAPRITAFPAILRNLEPLWKSFCCSWLRCCFASSVAVASRCQVFDLTTSAVFDTGQYFVDPTSNPQGTACNRLTVSPPVLFSRKRRCCGSHDPVRRCPPSIAGLDKSVRRHMRRFFSAPSLMLRTPRSSLTQLRDCRGRGVWGVGMCRSPFSVWGLLLKRDA